MLDRLKQLQVEALSEVATTTDLKELNDLRVKYLGKKGPIQEVMKNMKDMGTRGNVKVLVKFQMK